MSARCLLALQLHIYVFHVRTSHSIFFSRPRTLFALVLPNPPFVQFCFFSHIPRHGTASDSAPLTPNKRTLVPTPAVRVIHRSRCMLSGFNIPFPFLGTDGAQRRGRCWLEEEEIMACEQARSRVFGGGGVHVKRRWWQSCGGTIVGVL
jgi:hypothetical protein